MPCHIEKWTKPDKSILSKNVDLPRDSNGPHLDEWASFLPTLQQYYRLLGGDSPVSRRQRFKLRN